MEFSDLKTKSQYSVFILLLLLLISGCLCVILCNQVLLYYKEIQLLRILPASLSFSERDSSFYERPADGDLRIVLLGDSRISQWDECPDVKGASYVHLGIGGETSAQVLLRVNSDAVALEPEIVLLQVGINDLKTIGVFPEKRDSIVRVCKKNIGKIVESLRQNGIEVVVLTVFPPGKPSLLRRFVWSDEIYSAVKEVNVFIRGLGSEGIAIIDCDTVFEENGRIKPEYAIDTLHLSAKGYEKLNSIVKPVIENVLKEKVVHH